MDYTLMLLEWHTIEHVIIIIKKNYMREKSMFTSLNNWIKVFMFLSFTMLLLLTTWHYPIGRGGGMGVIKKTLEAFMY